MSLHPTEPAPPCPSCGAPLGDSGICSPCLLRNALAHSPPPQPLPDFRNTPSFPIPDTVLGDYRILEKLGEGAMGVVHRARKLSLKKDVAIKFMKAGAAASQRQRALFLREAELASHLDHPNIATVSEVGELDGRLFLVMRLIEGRPLSERLLEPTFRPTTRERVALLLEVTRAVHHAHQRGVIHRDLKPGNILIDPRGSPFVGDFGLARWLEQESTITYGDGFAIGTPAFMSPEQASGQGRDLTLVSDVWSLGVILYLLLSGRLPFEASSLPGLVHRIVTDDPLSPFERPSPSLPVPPAQPNTPTLPPPADLDNLARPARHDLESICLRCLEKAPGRRYPTAGALAEDLERWLDHRPVEARLPSATERLMRWAIRHPAASGIVAASAIAVAALAWNFWQREVNRRTEHLQRLFHYVADRNLAGYGLVDSNAVVFRRAMEAAAFSRAGPEVRGIETGLLTALGDAAFERAWFTADQPLLDIATPADSSNVVVLGATDLLILDGSGSLRHRAPLSGNVEPGSLAVSPTGDSLYVASSRGLHAFTAGSDTPRPLLAGEVHAPCLSRDGQRLGAIVSATTNDPSLRVVFLDPRTGTILGSAPFTPNPATTPVGLGWTDAGSLRRSTMASGIAELQPDPNGGPARLIELAAPGLRCPRGRFSHQANRYFRTSIYGVGHVFALPGGQTLLSLSDLPGNDAAIAFSHDDRFVAAATVDGSVRVRAIPEPGIDPAPERILIPGHVEAITSLAFGPDNSTVYTCSADRTVRRLLAGQPRPKPYLEIAHRLKTPAGVGPSFAPGRALVAVHEARFYGPNPGNDLTALCDPRSGQAFAELPGAIIGWGPANRALSCDRDGTLHVWNLATPAKPEHLSAFRPNPRHHGKIESKLADHDRWIVSVTDDGTLEALEAASGSVHRLDPTRFPELGTPAARPVAVEATATSQGSAFVAVNLAGRGTWLWDISHDRLAFLLQDVPAEMRFSPDGARIAVTDYHRRLRLFDGHTGAPAESLPGHLGTVSALAFTPDGRQLVTGGDDYTLVIWNLATQREVFRSNLRTRTFWIAISPDSQWLATAHLPETLNAQRTDVGNGQYRIWPLTHPPGTENSLTPDRTHPGSIWNHLDALARRFPAASTAPGG